MCNWIVKQKNKKKTFRKKVLYLSFYVLNLTVFSVSIINYHQVLQNLEKKMLKMKILSFSLVWLVMKKVPWNGLAISIECPFDMHIFSSPEPTAHRWAYRILMVRRPSVVRPSVPSSVRPSVRRPSLTISNFFFSETAWPIKAKFYVEPPWVGGTKVCSRHLSHMTKMAATPIYGKNPSKIFFSRTGRPIFTKLGM